MQLKLHKLATTTPAVRAALQRSRLPTKELAAKYGITPVTVRKWRNRQQVHDRSHTRHNLNRSLSTLDEQVVLELRRLGLSADTIMQVINKSTNLPKPFSVSAVYRCLKRYGVAGRPKLAKRAAYQPFEVVTQPGFLHLEVKYLPKLVGRRSYIYVAVDRATRYVYVKILYDLKAATFGKFVRRVCADFPLPVRVILTDNDFEWSDRSADGGHADISAQPPRASGRDAVDVVCRELRIEHRTTRLRHAQTNGMVESFDRRISEAFGRIEKIKANSGQNCFTSHRHRNQFIRQLVYNYNRTPQSCLDQHTPLTRLGEYNQRKNNNSTRQDD